MSPAGLVGWRSEHLDDVRVWLDATDDVDRVVTALRHLLKIRPATNGKRTRGSVLLDMDEAIRRTERRVAELIRVGQGRGYLSVTKPQAGQRRTQEVAARHLLHHCYVLFDGVSVDRFEAAITICRADGSLSRESIQAILHPERLRTTGGRPREWKSRPARIEEIRQLAIGGYRLAQIASMLGLTVDHVGRLAREGDVTLPEDYIGHRPGISADRVIGESISTLEGIAMAIQLIDPADADVDRVPGWAASLKTSLRTLNQLHKEMTR